MGNMHTLLDHRRLTDLAADPDFKPAVAPLLTRSDHMIAAGHARRAAYRALNPDADTAMTFGAQIGYLHAQIKTLDAELQAFNVVRDSALEYLTVDSPDFAVQLVVGYAYQPGYPAPPQDRTNKLAIGSIVASVIGLLCGIGSIVGIVLGAVALNQIKRSREGGYGLAVAGIVIGVASLVISIIWMTYALN